MDYLQIYKKVEPKVRIYFSQFEDYYRANALDYKDLRQEVMLMIWKLIEDNPDKNELDMIKFATKATRNLLLNLKRKSVKHLNKIPIDEVYEGNQSFTIYNNPTVVLDMLRNRISDKEYAVLSGILLEGKTQNEIAKSIGLSKARVGQIYARLLKKVEKFIKKSFTL